MNHWKLPAALTSITMVIGLGLQLWYWPQLPEQVATHFDAQGNPNDWMGKLPATLLAAGLVTLLPLFFIGIGQVIGWLPVCIINLPQRQYWLATERRADTLQWMTGWMMWLTVSITVFMVAINHLTFLANRDAQPLSVAWFWGMLGGFLLWTFVLVLVMLRRFAKPM
ncbi:MAG: DUF1648 domain-containing protein [Pirellulaceae bacterium]|nr:DUF1648 domain-containing protein [Pirellulaceae bacterium]